MRRRAALLLLALVLAMGVAGARAHDTWFAALPAARPGELHLALGTGERFPLHQVSVGGPSLVAAHCRGADGRSRPLRPQHDGERALQLVLDAAPGAPFGCWAQQAPQQLTSLAPDRIRLYLDEIRAPADVHRRWAALAARGVPWQETYTKHARFERGGGPRQPAPLGLDIVLDELPAVGGTLGFVVLRRGQPLPRFAVELVHGGSGLGFWLRTDATGRARVAVPLGGDWLLRGTDLRPHARAADAWESDFVTLAFSLTP